MLSHFFLAVFDPKIVAFFLAIRSSFGVAVFSAVSFLGDWRFLLPATLLVVLFLWLKNRRCLAVIFVGTVFLAEAVTFLGKIYFHRPRPLLAIFVEKDFSFPSGHAAIAVAFYGYLVYILIKSFKLKLPRLAIVLAIVLILAIGFSRLYLGVHYLSDVLAGYAVGLVALALGIILTNNLCFRRK